MKTKVCTKCKIEKCLTVFSNHKNNKDGLSRWCKKCCSVWQRDKNIEIKKLIDYSRVCAECNIDFKAKRLNQKYCCKKCYHAYYIKNNKEQLKNKR